MEIEPHPQSIDEALTWHSAIIDSISAHRATVYSAASAGTAVPALFVGLTIVEVEGFFRDEQAEVDGMCIVNIVAAAEASIRADYRDRIRRNRSELLSQAYVAHHRTLSGAKAFRPNFDEDGILDAMRSAGNVALHLVSDFRRVLKLRHWYAHGRHWLLRTKTIDDPITVHRVCANLIDALDVL